MPPVPKDTAQISRSKPYRLRRAPAGFTLTALDGYGLRDRVPARPTVPASYPISVRQVATLLHASFRRALAEPPLRFASASPPSGCTGDLHPQAVEHVRHTLRAHKARPFGLRELTAQRGQARRLSCQKCRRSASYGGARAECFARPQIGVCSTAKKLLTPGSSYKLHRASAQTRQDRLPQE